MALLRQARLLRAQDQTGDPHQADVHDEDVVWHKCDADPDKCDYQSKRVGTLYAHIRRCHARVYAQRKKEQEERVRRALLDAGWQEWRLAETTATRRLLSPREAHRLQVCADLNTDGKFASIDFVLGVLNGFVFLEVDEQQHKYGYGGLVSCDMKRMSHVMESLAVETATATCRASTGCATTRTRGTWTALSAQDAQGGRRGAAVVWRGSRRLRGSRRCASATRSTTARAARCGRA